MPIKYTDTSGKTLVAHLAPGVTPAQAAQAMGLAGGSWQEITAAQAEALQQPTAEELGVAARAKRDALLASSDWTQLPDSPLSSDARAAWATYRQALRDITEQEGFPQEIVWPEVPA
jgi:hypothetical protein